MQKQGTQTAIQHAFKRACVVLSVLLCSACSSPVGGGGSASFSGSSDEAPETCSPTPKLNGGLSMTGWTDKSIDFTNASLYVTLEHKQDVDANEAGCVGAVAIEVRAHPEGCALTMRFRASTGGGPLTLMAATLAVDSFCPGWSDAEEGTYSWNNAGGLTISDVLRVDDHDQSLASHIGSIALSGTFKLEHWAGGAPLGVSVTGVIEGCFVSSGETTLSVPTSCALLRGPVPDATDTGPPPADTTAPPTTIDNTCVYANDGVCDETGGLCDPGTDCTDCGTCGPVEDTCGLANNGTCDEPAPCLVGTDCTDCGTCNNANNSCEWANDGQCDEPLSCEKGTDCTDCGDC